jgi:phage baseplate assembly protein W|tara:strand:+ start:950 stop:1360 length:411 start_codon:yes stop_codon:yes gene_type:complete
MAFEVKKIAPIDLQPRKAVGVKLPFSGKAVFNQTFQTKEALKTNLINYFLTARGERYLNPTFGNRLQTLLFEQLTQQKIAQIDELIRNDLEVYFPRVEPVKINTQGTPDNNSVSFSLSYRLRETDIEDELIINFEQ